MHCEECSGSGKCIVCSGRGHLLIPNVNARGTAPDQHGCGWCKAGQCFACYGSGKNLDRLAPGVRADIHADSAYSVRGLKLNGRGTKKRPR